MGQRIDACLQRLEVIGGRADLHCTDQRGLREGRVASGQCLQGRRDCATTQLLGRAEQGSESAHGVAVMGGRSVVVGVAKGCFPARRFLFSELILHGLPGHHPHCLQRAALMNELIERITSQVTQFHALPAPRFTQGIMGRSWDRNRARTTRNICLVSGRNTGVAARQQPGCNQRNKGDPDHHRPRREMTAPRRARLRWIVGAR